MARFAHGQRFLEDRYALHYRAVFMLELYEHLFGFFQQTGGMDEPGRF
jgi:hypothetical protein